MHNPRNQALERIVWPHVKNKLIEQLIELEEKLSNTQMSATSSALFNFPAVAVVEAAMIIESGWDDLLDAVWVVRSPSPTAHERLIQHRNLHPDEAMVRIQAQSNRRGIGNVEEEVAKGSVTAVIDNDGCLNTLTRKLLEAWNDPNCWKVERD